MTRDPLDDPRLSLVQDVAARRGGLVVRQDALNAGVRSVDLDGLIRHGRLLRVQRGVYVEPDPPLSPVLRARAALLAAGPGAVASGHTAAALLGLELVARPAYEEVTVPRGTPRRCHRSELRWCYDDLDPCDVVGRAPLLLTAPPRTLVDLLCRADRLTALWACERALSGNTDRDEVAAALDRTALGRRRAEVLERWAEVDARSESPLETAVRLALLDAGLPRPVLQHRVYDEQGRVVARLDLAYPKLRLGIEADGCGPHDRPKAIYRDNRRAHRLASLGWQLLRFTWYDAVHAPGALAAEVAGACRARRS